MRQHEAYGQFGHRHPAAERRLNSLSTLRIALVQSQRKVGSLQGVRTRRLTEQRSGSEDSNGEHAHVHRRAIGHDIAVVGFAVGAR